MRGGDYGTYIFRNKLFVLTTILFLGRGWSNMRIKKANSQIRKGNACMMEAKVACANFVKFKLFQAFSELIYNYNLSYYELSSNRSCCFKFIYVNMNMLARTHANL